MKIKLYLLALTSCLNIIYGQYDYELEFMDINIYTPCENYPNNFIDQLFDMSNLNIEQTEDSSIVINGYTITPITVERILPFSIEIFKKERGTWQPTVYNQKRNDTCMAIFSKTEFWSSYLKNIPDTQKTCPFTKGQRLDFDVNEPTYISLPLRNGEGEYKIQAKAGTENSDLFACFNIFVFMHRM